jgi:hypothetical protein
LPPFSWASTPISRSAAWRRSGGDGSRSPKDRCRPRPTRFWARCRTSALIGKKTAVEIGILRVELVLGIWIGAVTFTGSVVAYGKLAGNSSLLPFKIDTAAKQLPGGHMLNAAAAAARCCC